MKAKVNGEKFSYIAALAARAAGGKSEPVEAHRYTVLRAEPGRLSALAGRTGLSILAYSEADVANAGEIGVPARLLADVASYLADQEAVNIDLEVEAPLTLRVEARNSVSRLKGVDAEFVALPSPFNGDVAFTIGASALAEALEQTLFAAGDSKARPILGSVLMRAQDGLLRLVASDGFRLSEATIPLISAAAPEQADEALVPAETLSMLAALTAKAQAGETVGVRLPPRPDNKRTTRWAVFQLPGAWIGAALMEGEYPEYRRLIPSNEPLARAEVEKDDLARAARRLIALTEGGRAASTVAARLTFEAGGLWLRDNAPHEDQRASSSILDAQVSGGTIDVGVDAVYVAQACRAAPTERVVLECRGPERPLVVKPAGASGWLHLIMPMRLQ